MTTKKEQIAKLLAKGKTVAEIVTIVECSDALVYMTRKEINERGGDNKIIDAVVDDDTVKPKERIMPRPKKDSEGGRRRTSPICSETWTTSSTGRRTCSITSRCCRRAS
jgi:hypothetical protein